MARVRYASTSDHTTVNTHPFVQDGRLFAHNGVVEGLAELDARLAELGAAHLVHGQTDSERIFALISAETARQQGDLFDGLLAATTWISDHLPVYALNLVMSTATDLWALRYPAVHDLYLLNRPAGGAGASRALDARSSRIHAQSPHLATRACVLVASERMDDDPDWRLLDPGERLHVNSHLAIDRIRPPPFHPASPPRPLRSRFGDGRVTAPRITAAMSALRGCARQFGKVPTPTRLLTAPAPATERPLITAPADRAEELPNRCIRLQRRASTGS